MLPGKVGDFPHSLQFGRLADASQGGLPALHLPSHNQRSIRNPEVHTQPDQSECSPQIPGQGEGGLDVLTTPCHPPKWRQRVPTEPQMVRMSPDGGAAGPFPRQCPGTRSLPSTGRRGRPAQERGSPRGTITRQPGDSPPKSGGLTRGSHWLLARARQV